MKHHTKKYCTVVKRLLGVTYVKVASFKPHTDSRVLTYTDNMRDKEVTEDLMDIIRVYHNAAVEHNKERINEQLTPVYGRPLVFADNMTTDVLEKLARIMKLTGKTVKEISDDFRQYLGKSCTFFRKEGSKQIPVESERILMAYLAMKEKKPRYQVENILYF